MIAEHKSTDWRKVKKGTKVLFRRTKESYYEEATFGGLANTGAYAGAFCWRVGDASGNLLRFIGASITETCEWHIDPHYCKLA
jgi:hypothetical protein